MKHFIALSLAALSLPVFATSDGTPINERRPLSATGTLSVSNVSGLIEVRAWNKNEVEITGTLGEGSEKLGISGGADRLRVEVVLPRRARDVESSELFLRVPEGTRLELEGVSADVTVSGTRGPVRASSVSGDVRISGAMSEVRAESVSGDVDVQAPSTSTRLESVSGDIEASQLSGTLRAETVSGDLTVSGSSFREINLEAVSGDVEVNLSGLADDAEVSADTVSGNIRFNVPKSLNTRLTLETYSGELRSDFGRAYADEPERIEATLGKGQGRMKLESHSGDLILKAR